MNSEELKVLSINLSHDIRTPLATIKAGASGIRDFLPLLIDAYHKACNAKLIDNSIQPRHIALLTKTLINIELSANLANQQITEFVDRLRNFSTSKPEIQKTKKGNR